VGELHKGVIHALLYAQTLAPSVKGVDVELDPDRTRRLEEKWIKCGMGVPLVVLSSPYRSLLQLFLVPDGAPWQCRRRDSFIAAPVRHAVR